jgi:GNAT superfamily N-acetyltransferase
VAAVKENPGTLIREARAEDIPALAQLCGELGYVSDESQVRRRLARVNEDKENRILVAEDVAGAVIGWVQVHFTRWLASDPRGEVVGLVVSAKSRGCGIGRKLMQAAETWTKEQGGAEVAVRSNLVRKETHLFYQRLGYAVTKTSLNFRKQL